MCSLDPLQVHNMYITVFVFVSVGFRILKVGVPLSRTFSTALVRTHKAGDACAQNDKKGGSAEPKEPPWIRHCVCVCVCVNVGWGRPASQRPWWLPRHSSRDLAVQGSPTLASQTGGHRSPVECTPALWQTLGSPHPSL